MRLIDADALEESLKNSCKDTYETKMFVDFMDYVDESPTIEQSEDCISREEAIRIAEQGQIQGYEWQFKELCNLPSVTASYNSISTELKPCEDCISREKVRRLICKNNDKYGYSNRFHEFTEECLKLPSVTPTRLPGHWITNSDYPDKLICSECDSKFDVWWMDKGSNYCPNCGAKMKEEENETNN